MSGNPAAGVNLGPLADFPDGSHRVVRVGRREIGVFRIGSDFHALPNLCPHQLGPLCEAVSTTGTVEATPNAQGGWDREFVRVGQIIQCPWHQLEYDITTGQCLAFPEIVLRRYDVVVEDEQIRLIA